MFQLTIGELMPTPSVALVLQQREEQEFVRSGLVYIYKVAERQTFREADENGWAWTASPVADSKERSRSLYFTLNVIASSYGPITRFHALPLRCLSTTAVGNDNQKIVRSGDINYNDDTDRQSFRWIGIDGYGWSSSATDKSESTTVYYLDFGASGAVPSYGPKSRRFGFPLRCLSTTAVENEQKRQKINPSKYNKK